MKEKDLLLLASIRANARETLTKISRKTKIPISTIFDRLRQHENTIIKKHTAIIDFSKLGFSTRVTMTFKTAKPDKEAMREYLEKHCNVNSLYKINNGFDFLVEGVFKNIKDMEDFIENVEERFKVRSKQVYYIVEDIKREDFLSNENTVGLVA